MLHVALPLGDTELLQRVRQRCTTGEPRAAGVSCLIDAELPARARRPSPDSDSDPPYHPAVPAPDSRITTPR